MKSVHAGRPYLKGSLKGCVLMMIRTAKLRRAGPGTGQEQVRSRSGADQEQEQGRSRAGTGQERELSRAGPKEVRSWAGARARARARAWVGA